MIRGLYRLTRYGPRLFSQEKTDKGGRDLREGSPRSFWRVEVKGAMLEPIDSQAEYRLECLAFRIQGKQRWATEALAMWRTQYGDRILEGAEANESN